MEQKVDYIFCINTGRSGSDYLARLFSHVLGCCAFHEPMPICNGQAMKQYLSGDPKLINTLVQQKIEMIQESMRDCKLYVESNHCFIKGFGWFIPQCLPEDRIGVVILTRDKTKIADSYFKLGDTPLQPTALNWLISPGVNHPFTRPPRRFFLSSKMTHILFRILKIPFRGGQYYKKIFLTKPQTPQWIVNYELECLKWYVDETAARTRAFQKKFPKIKYYEVDIENLNDIEEVTKMLNYFGCSPKSSLMSVVGKPTNQREKEKASLLTLVKS